eukprot:scaffold1518_cov417-Prasinococcus_capsulatus_cf.AAC.4
MRTACLGTAGVDVQVPGIDTYPKGFDMHYTLGREERLLTVSVRTPSGGLRAQKCPSYNLVPG